MKIAGFEIKRQTKSLTGGSFSTGTQFYSNQLPPSPFAAALNTLISTDNYKKSPRELLALYNLMYHVFPFFERAFTIHQDFMGMVEFTSEDEGLQKALNDWAEEVPIFIPGSPYENDRGMSNYAHRLLADSMASGSAFSELMRAESGIEVTGLLHANPECFNFIQLNGIYYLVYNGISGQVVIKELGDLSMFQHNPSGKFPWGTPMGYNAEFFITKATRFIEARVSFEERIGNPNITTVFSPDMNIPEANLPTIQQYQDTHDRIIEAARLQNDAALHRLRTGKASDIIVTSDVPLTITQHTHGQGVAGSTGFSEILDQFLSALHLVTDVPSIFLGIDSPAGLGSEKFRVEKSFLTLRANTNRQRIEPTIYKASDNWLLGQKVNPKWLTAYDIKWCTPNVDDEKLAADTELVNAQTLAQQVANFDALLQMDAEAESANLYAEQIGKPEWKSNPGTGAGL